MASRTFRRLLGEPVDDAEAHEDSDDSDSDDSDSDNSNSDDDSDDQVAQLLGLSWPTLWMLRLSWPTLWARVKLCATTGLLTLDMYTDGGVIVTMLQKSYYVTAVILAFTVIVPQLLAWLFLWAQGVSSATSAIRLVMFPALSLLLLGLLSGLHLKGDELPQVAWDVAAFIAVLSPEPFAIFLNSWNTGQETPKAIWFAMAEGLVEAPASAVLAIYMSMLASALSSKGMDTFLQASAVISLASISYRSVKLHTYGQSLEVLDSLRFLGIKFAAVSSQITTYVLFAFLTRPFPTSAEALVTENSCYLPFVFLALECSLDLGLLRTVSPQMPPSVAAILAASMVVGSMPGFLPSLHRARPAHAVQHFGLALVMAALALRAATADHWRTLLKHYLALVVLWALSSPVACLCEVLVEVRGSSQQRLQAANEALDKATETGDVMTARLLIDSEGLEVPPACGIFMDTGKGKGDRNWDGICAQEDRLYCAPWNAAEVLVLEPSTGAVSFIDTGKGKGGANWTGTCAHEGRLYCAPLFAAEVLGFTGLAENMTVEDYIKLRLRGWRALDVSSRG